MAATLETSRGRTGGVTVESSDLLSDTELVVDDDVVNLRGSLQQNLTLELTVSARGVPLDDHDPGLTVDGLERVVSRVDPRREKIGRITADEPTSAITATVDFFERRGLRVDLHPKHASSSLRFGACVD